MRASVRSGFVAFTTPLEGSLDFMYLDREFFVTTARGNKIDPIGQALVLPWENQDGSRASASAIAGEWTYVKSRTDLAPQGGAVFVNVTSLRLPPEAIDALDVATLATAETWMRGAFRTWDVLPADAQLGCLSMAWAMGDGFARKFPKFTAAINALDLATARAECHMLPTPGIGPRNAANALLFENAAAVIARGLSRETLYYPHAVPAAGGVGGSGGAFRALAGVALLGGLGFGAWRLWVASGGGSGPVGALGRKLVAVAPS